MENKFVEFDGNPLSRVSFKDKPFFERDLLKILVGLMETNRIRRVVI
jgi:hypothetical protein